MMQAVRWMLGLGLPVIFLVPLAHDLGSNPKSVGLATHVRQPVHAVRSSKVLHLQVNSRLQIDDLLRSGKSACLKAEFLDGTQLTVGESAELRVNSYVYDPVNAKQYRLVVRLKGALLFISGKLKSPGEVMIITQYAVVGVRGTVFWSGIRGICDLGHRYSHDNRWLSNAYRWFWHHNHQCRSSPNSPTLWSEEKRNRATTTTMCQ